MDAKLSISDAVKGIGEMAKSYGDEGKHGLIYAAAALTLPMSDDDAVAAFLEARKSIAERVK